jgi:hypothetical protein
MSVYSEEEHPYVDGSVQGSVDYECHEYNNYFDYTSEKSAEDSFRQHKHVAKGARFEDKGYNRVRRSFKGDKRNMFIEYYETSASPNVYIRDAISGAIRAPYRTGTANEDLFFSVRLATGETRANGSNLYYDSPEQYERHFRIEVPESVKQTWRIRAMEARDRINTPPVDPSAGPKVIVVK